MGDLFSERDRASAMALFSLGPLLGMSYVPSGIIVAHANPILSGPAIGPVAGGFITAAGGIKWVFIAIACESLVSPTFRVRR